MHKCFSGDNVTCRVAVSICQADFPSLLPAILKPYLKGLNSPSHLNSRSCHCFPLVPNSGFHFFFFIPSVLQELSSVGAAQGNLEDLIVLRQNQMLTSICGFWAAFHAWNLALSELWALEILIPRGTRWILCWSDKYRINPSLGMWNGITAVLF